MISTYKDAVKWLSDEYRDLNGTGIEIVDGPPTSLEFARLVHISRPVIIKGCNVSACQQWTDPYLVEKMGNSLISVAVTPNGRADSIVQGQDKRLYFTEPLVEKMTMKEFMSKINPSTKETPDEIYYLQSQNGNLFSAKYFAGYRDKSEFEPLRADVPSDIPWCTEALGTTPDAVNVWMGSSDSITSIHSDPYENLYAVVCGTKHFTLLPPSDGWSLEERLYPHATYTRSSPNSKLIITPSPEQDYPLVRWSSVSDPHLPGSLPSNIRPINVTVHPGEMLYLPVGWWHHVRQSGPITIALNWWYDAEMRGMSWVMLNFFRQAIPIPLGNDQEKNSEDE